MRMADARTCRRSLLRVANRAKLVLQIATAHVGCLPSFVFNSIVLPLRGILFALARLSAYLRRSGPAPVVALVLVGWFGCAPSHKVERVPATSSSIPNEAASPPASRVAPGIDGSKPDVESLIVVRAQLLAREPACDKYCWSRVKVLDIALNDLHKTLSSEIRVASRSGAAMIPDGVSTLYLAPYNQYVPQGLWRLAQDDTAMPLVPTDGQIARVWQHALLSGDRAWLADATALPFLFRSSGPDERCQRDLKAPTDFQTWLACVGAPDGALLEGLDGGEQVVVQAGMTTASPKLRDLGQAIRTPGTWVQLLATGEGIHAELLLRVQQDGLQKRVSACLADVVLGSRGLAARKRRSNYAALVDAIERDDVQAVRTLLRNGASVNDTGRDDFPGDPPVTVAADKGRAAIVDVLLAAGANPNDCCCSCVTALHRAIAKQHVAIVRRLLESGADPRILYDGRMSTLDLARQGGNPEIVRMVERELTRRSTAP